MTLEVDIRLARGGFTLETAFESQGGLTAIFGRSGSGKTSLVDVIGGLLTPDAGRVAVNGEVLVDRARGISVSPHRRRLGYVFQEARLFPHLTVRQNLAYGRWFTPRGERRGSLGEVAALLDIEGLLDRQPGTLSGGERQRVAIGRALLASPRLLLMDEPFSSLDEGRKSDILPVVERLRDEAGVPIVYVSHSVPEVVRLAETVVVLSEGRVAAAGPPREIMSRVDLFPATGRAEAGAMLDGTVLGHDAAYGLTQVQVGPGILTIPGTDQPVGAALRAWVRARDVILSLDPPQGLSALNALPATIREIGAADGPIVDLSLDCGGQVLRARLTRRSVEMLELAPGRAVYAIVKSIAFGERAVSDAGHPRNGMG